MGTKKKPSIASLAKRYSVTPACVRKWQAKGYPIFDADQLAAKLDEQRRGPDVRLTPLVVARLRKLGLESERIAFENAIRRGEYRRVDEAGAELRGWLERLYNELQLAVHCEFPAWAGLTAAEIESRGVAWQRAMSDRLNDSARAWTPPAVPEKLKQ